MPVVESLGIKAFKNLMKNPSLYKLSSKLGRFVRWGKTMPNFGIAPLSSWQATRDFPAPNQKSFRDLWNEGLNTEAAPKLEVPND